MSTSYKIKPLQWERTRYPGGCSYQAVTPFGSFNINQSCDDGANRDSKWQVDYYFHQWYDQDEACFATIRECKDWAEGEWNERMMKCLEEVKP